MNPDVLTTTTPQILYAIPGLGTDERIFSRLNLPFPIHFLKWPEPIPHESLRDYSLRMAEQISDKEPVVILGVSFGGIIAQEISLFRPVAKILLISGILSPEELPLHFSIMRILPLYRLSRGKWRIYTLSYWSRLFGIYDKEEQALLKAIFQTFSDNYRMWAIRQLVGWKGVKTPVEIARLHGNRDRVFPIRKTKNPDILKNGNHFMIYQEAALISEWVGLQIDKKGCL
ncbi:MAG: alpha/beta hydrolase [Bacteroidia bacterium]|nr:alpha/beta hydrolase [Bacteroidia bacterium]